MFQLFSQRCWRYLVSIVRRQMTETESKKKNISYDKRSYSSYY